MEASVREKSVEEATQQPGIVHSCCCRGKERSGSHEDDEGDEGDEGVSF